MSDAAMKRSRHGMSKTIFMQRLELFVLYFLLILMAAAFVVPFFWLLSSSFKEPSELFEVPVHWLPKRIQFANYAKMFNTIPFWLYLRNTMTLVLFNIIGSLISCSLAAYGFSRLRWKGRDQLFVLVLITMAAKSDLMCYVTLGLAALYLMILLVVIYKVGKKKSS